MTRDAVGYAWHTFQSRYVLTLNNTAHAFYRLSRASHTAETVMNKHKLTLMGGSHRELRVPAGLLHKAIGVLLTGARQAVRVTVEGESLRKGRSEERRVGKECRSRWWRAL